MANWKKVGTDLVSGAVAGGLDQVCINKDNARKAAALAAGKKFGLMNKYGAYLNYGVPVLAVAGVATNFLRGDWATRAVTIGGQLAGRAIAEVMLTPKAAGFRPAQWNAGYPPLRQDKYTPGPNGTPQPIEVGPLFRLFSRKTSLALAAS